jgi:hypothetical protein
LRLALYGRRSGDLFDLAGLYRLPDGEFGVFAARSTDGEELVKRFRRIEEARAAATEFIGSTSEIDWILQGSPLAWIEEWELHLRDGGWLDD